MSLVNYDRLIVEKKCRVCGFETTTHELEHANCGGTFISITYSALTGERVTPHGPEQPTPNALYPEKPRGLNGAGVAGGEVSNPQVDEWGVPQLPSKGGK